MTGIGSPPSPLQTVVPFEVLLPQIHGNGTPIPFHQIEDVEREIEAKWGFGNIERRNGNSCWALKRNFAWDQAAEVWDWFTGQCPRWANRFGQPTIDLCVWAPWGKWICVPYPPPYRRQPQVPNPYRSTPAP